jgi:plasmid stabilization system protein ParE
LARVVWAPSALHDVARLHRFLAQRNQDAARRAVEAIRQGLTALVEAPAPKVCNA